MPFDTITVTGGATVGTLLADVDEVCTLLNTDPTNFLVLSDVNSALPGDILTAPLGPGQVISVDGTSQIYGSALAGVSIEVFKFPGSIQFSNVNALTPTQIPASFASNEAASGSTVDLVGFGLNPQKLSIQLILCSMSAVLYSASGPAISGTDAIQDDHGTVYVPLQVGLPSSGGVIAPTLALNMAGTVVPAGRRLQLVNGASIAGVVHQCAAMVSYYLLNDPT
jgi:hypothetical protein